MSYIFKALEPEYVHDLSICRTLRRRAVQASLRAMDILELKPRYRPISDETGIPIVWLMAINERESGSKMRTYLGNGQTLRRRTTQVPRGRGPFKTWEAGAMDALRLARVDKVKDWSWPRMVYEAEKYNGFGPRMHHRRTGYNYGGTNLYDGGKYVKDGKWKADAKDRQLGTIPIMRALIAVDPSLEVPGRPDLQAKSIKLLLRDPTPHPDLDVHGILWVQQTLNDLDDARLLVDGNLGRHTAAAVSEFQEANDLLVDGIPGQDTKSAMEAALGAKGGSDG